MYIQIQIKQFKIFPSSFIYLCCKTSLLKKNILKKDFKLKNKIYSKGIIHTGKNHYFVVSTIKIIAQIIIRIMIPLQSYNSFTSWFLLSQATLYSFLSRLCFSESRIFSARTVITYSIRRSSRAFSKTPE